jgi:hypothetical protein
LSLMPDPPTQPAIQLRTSPAEIYQHRALPELAKLNTAESERQAIIVSLMRSTT